MLGARSHILDQPYLRDASQLQSTEVGTVEFRLTLPPTINESAHLLLTYNTSSSSFNYTIKQNLHYQIILQLRAFGWEN